ncbi:MAG: fumarylacetoacetate hydrolase family protein [Candidatus Tectomicrobia bacterium]|nr:fumarylacetoacetate hydrolase family protein [Candidatus Tectomicrobia bacterium]
MRLATFNDHRLGVVRDGTIVDVTEALGNRQVLFPLTAMHHVIYDYEELAPQLRARAEAGPAQPLGDVRLMAPLPHPTKIVAVGLNYKAHSIEMGYGPKPAPEPEIFLKSPGSVIGPGGSIQLPDMPGRVFHHECELAFVVRSRLDSCPASQAMDAIFGYTMLIDVTVRGQGDRCFRKSMKGFTPIGPWIVTADEVPNPENLDIKLWVNDELRQHANTNDLIWSIPEVIEYTSRHMILTPGDVFTTGTPAGVGPLAPGDVVRIEIESIGSMTVSVTSSAAGPAAA